jgi:hypothetical protein
MTNEGEGTQMEKELETVGTDQVGSVGEVLGTEEQAPVSESFFTTEPYDVPAATPKRHSGSVTGVALLETKTGSTGIEIKYHSDSNGRDYEQVIWPPAAWIANPNISRADLEALPTAEGKKQSPLQRFGSAITNSKGTGDFDKLFAAAKKAERTIPRPTYTTIQEFVEMVNGIFSGMPVKFTTREEKNDDPQYQARERVNAVYPYDFDLTKLKNYAEADGSAA